jgi:hypothetical protein
VILAFAMAVANVANAGPVEEVPGFGRTVEDAKSDARQHALKMLRDRLAMHDPPLTAWEPTLRDIEALIDNPGHAGPSDIVEPIGLQHRWILPVRFPSDEEMVRRELQTQRGKATVWVLIAASVLLVGVALWNRK